MNKLKIDYSTYFLLVMAFLCGFIKNMLIIFGIVLFHEMGHIILSLIFKRKIISITIYPFGGITKCDELINNHKKADVLIYLGGIIFQLILWLIMFFFFKQGTVDYDTYNLFNYYNRLIIAFNFLPIIPLDGYLIMNYFFNSFFSFKNAYFLSLLLSSIIFFLFFLKFYEKSLSNILLLIFLVYEFIIYIKNFKYLFNRFLLERYLYKLNYDQIRYSKKNKLTVLQKNNEFYFWRNHCWVNEKSLLEEHFN